MATHFERDGRKKALKLNIQILRKYARILLEMKIYVQGDIFHLEDIYTIRLHIIYAFLLK